MGMLKRAEVLCDFQPTVIKQTSPTPAPTLAEPVRSPAPPAIKPSIRLRDAFDRWAKAQTRTADSVANCGRALALYEKHTSNPPLLDLTRAEGVDFRGKLQGLGSTSKTARDRLNWVKGLLKFAAQDLELIPKSPWTGLDIKARTTRQRQPWCEEHLATLLSHEIWQKGALPTDKKAGGLAAYWIPLLGLYTGARCSELCQLRVEDVDITSEIPMIKITDEGAEQNVKSDAGRRVIPLHSELLRLGFLNYVRTLSGGSLWPTLPLRSKKPGGYFSQWFGILRRELSIPATTDFHSFRHTVRTALSHAEVPEPTIDRLLGHESGGSVGARVYTHVNIRALRDAIERLGDLSTCSLPGHHTDSLARLGVTP